MTTLPLLGDLAAVVLAAMPVVLALPLALAHKTKPFVSEWLRTLDPGALADVIDHVMPPGTAFEANFAGQLAFTWGAALGGTFRFHRPAAQTFGVAYSGRVAGIGMAGVGGAVGYERGDRSGSSAGVQASVGVGAEVEWLLDPAAVANANIAVIDALFHGRMPAAGAVQSLLDSQEPDTLITELAAAGTADAGEGVAHIEVDALEGGPLSAKTGVEGAALGLQAGTNLAGALFSGAFAACRAEAKLSSGYDGEGALLAAELSGSAAASLFGCDGHEALTVRLVARDGDASVAKPGEVPIRGTLELSTANDDDRATTRLTWKSLLELDNLVARVRLPAADPTGSLRLDPGELLVEREHHVDEPATIDDLLDGTPAGDGLLRLVVGHAEARYDAAVSVRMSADTSAAFPGIPPANEELARDRQRALAAVILGESYVADAPVTLAGATECATLVEATITFAAEVGAALSGKAGLGAEGSAGISAGVAVKREHDITAAVGVDDVERILGA